MSANGDRPMSDEELHEALRRYEPEYKGDDGVLTDDQRQVRLKRLQKYQAKEQQEQAKAARKKGKEPATKNQKQAEKKPVKEVDNQLIKELEIRSTRKHGLAPPIEEEPQPKKGRGGGAKASRVNTVSDGNVTLQLTDYRGNTDYGTPSTIRQETVIHSPITSKRGVMVSSVGGAACIDLRVSDVTLGGAADHLHVSLYGLDTDKSWKLLAQRKTSADGDCPGLITPDLFQAGVYKLHLDTGEYFQHSNIFPAFPFIEVVFEVVDPMKTYKLHIDLGPYSYTTSINN